jgi:hypothetical protein
MQQMKQVCSLSYSFSTFNYNMFANLFGVTYSAMKFMSSFMEAQTF